MSSAIEVIKNIKCLDTGQAIITRVEQDALDEGIVKIKGFDDLEQWLDKKIKRTKKEWENTNDRISGGELNGFEKVRDKLKEVKENEIDYLNEARKLIKELEKEGVEQNE